MITYTDSFTKLVSVGLLLGIFFAMIQSLFQGAKEINFAQIFMGYILYAIMFVPTSTVLIQDNYTGTVDVVDNVPIGIAAAGSIISTVGMNVGEMFKLNYQAVDVEDTKFAESLKLLNDTRRGIADNRTWDALSLGTGIAGTDLKTSWLNYIRECTLIMIDRGEKTVDELFTSEMPDALRFDSGIYHTEVKVGGHTQTVNCSSAYGIITNEMNSSLRSDVFSKAFLSSLGLDATGTSAQNAVTGSLQRLGMDSTDSNKFMMAALLEPIYFEAAAGKYQDFHDSSSAVMLNQAIMQRNTQWASEQSMFMTIARPLMTFFEGFVYAITPFVAFLLVIGSFGTTIALKYVQTLLWIQLWIPVMSIINLYIHTAASQEMAFKVANTENGTLDSFYALNSTGDVLSHWIAVGGMLAASTPMISLFIVSGSTYAMTSLVNGFKGGDSINEKISTPDAVQPSAVMSSQPMQNYSHLTGMAGGNAGAMMGQLSMGSSIGNSVQSSKQNLESAQQSFSSSLGTSLQSGTNENQTYSQLAQLGATASAGTSKSAGLINQRAHGLMSANQSLASHGDAVKGVVAAVASGAISGELGAKMLKSIGSSESGETGKGNERVATSDQNSNSTGAGLKVGANLSIGGEKTTTDQRTATQSETVQIGDALSFTDEEKSTTTNQLANSVAEANKKDVSAILGKSDTQDFKKAAQNVNQSQKAYSETSSLAKAFEDKNTFGLQEIGSRVAGNQQASKELNNYWNSGNVGQETKDEAQRLERLYSAPVSHGGYGLSPENALASARLKALSNTANHKNATPENIINNTNAAMKAIGTATGLDMPNLGNHAENQGIKPVNNSGLNNAVNAETSGVQANTDEARNIDPNAPQLGPVFQDPATATPTDLITQKGAANDAQIKQAGQEKQNQRYAAAESGARNDYYAHSPKYSLTGAQEVYGGVDNVIGFAERRAEEVVNAGKGLWEGAKTGGEAANNAFKERLQELKENPELAQAVIQAANDSDGNLEEKYGLAGRIVAGLSQTGRGIIGAAAQGMEAVQQFTSDGQALANGDKQMSDFKDYSLQEQGAIYSAAMAHALSEGSTAGLEKFKEVAQTDFRNQFMEKAMSEGLTREQAAVFANSYDNLFEVSNSQQLEQAKMALAETYAMRDENGEIMRNEDNSPMLTKEDQKFVNRLNDDIQLATRATPETTGSYLTGIAGYNLKTGRTDRLID